MRIIKFRGVDVIGRKFVYGDLVHNQKVTQTGFEPRVMVGGYEVEPETVGQFTGLKDKNGKEIYEGDIVRYNYYGAGYSNATGEEEQPVVFENCRFWPIVHERVNNIEVVGNIYGRPVGKRQPTGVLKQMLDELNKKG